MRLGLLVLVGAVLGLALASSSATAEVDGPCQFIIGGEDIAGLDSSDPGDALQVGENDTLDYTLNAQGGIVAWDSSLTVGPYTRTVAEGTSESGTTTISETVPVSEFTWLGVGLYKLTGTLTLEDGSTCEGAVLFNVEGNPLTTVIGGSAAGATALGALGTGHAAWSGYTAASQGAGFFKP